VILGTVSIEVTAPDLIEAKKMSFPAPPGFAHPAQKYLLLIARRGHRNHSVKGRT
jgi:hypothetical protein